MAHRTARLNVFGRQMPVTRIANQGQTPRAAPLPRREGLTERQIEALGTPQPRCLAPASVGRRSNRRLQPFVRSANDCRQLKPARASDPVKLRLAPLAGQ